MNSKFCEIFDKDTYKRQTILCILNCNGIQVVHIHMNLNVIFVIVIFKQTLLYIKYAGINMQYEILTSSLSTPTPYYVYNLITLGEVPFVSNLHCSRRI